jgi:outer membrane protein assembly factor BamB/putative NIF3 family GTP cyclohydrolase 1 type 2
MRISRRQFAYSAAAGLAAAPPPLTARQVVERIQKNIGVPWNPKSYRDTFKAGDPDTPVKGIATTFMATLDVLQRALAAGRNFVITHEPTFWNDADVVKDLGDDPVYRFKLDFIEKNRLVVWRSHDHMHARKPDMIFLGWDKALGWEGYLDPSQRGVYQLPPTTVAAVARHLAARLKTPSIRIVGDPQLKVRTVGLGSHVLEGALALLPRVDVLVVFEARERDAIEYARDTVLSGQNKALIALAHEAGEEEGMREMALWLRPLVPEVPVDFVPAGDQFWIPAAARNWPQFRGPEASGIGQARDIRFDQPLWKTPIPGLAHSSPIAWGERVFISTAVSGLAGATFRRGLFGEGDASTDLSVHQWKLLCLDLRTGKLLWDRLAYEGTPKEKRHIKSTYASATPATDGKVVVAFFGSQGIYAFDLDGKPLWKRDLGRLDVGAYDAPQYEWGTASSPILHQNLVIVQCDQQKGSFLIALDRMTGETVWRTPREELPSWGTPSVLGAELVTNGSNFVRGYDAATGKELWKVGGSSRITAPTPVRGSGLTIVASGRRPEAPIFAIRPGGQVAWQKQQRGPYMPTPLIYDGLLYVLGNMGVLDCYVLETGEEVYRQRIPHAGSGFSASPVVADGKIYLSSEDGDLIVVRAGRKFELLGKKEIGESLMATPAIAGGLFILRSEHHAWAFGP